MPKKTSGRKKGIRRAFQRRRVVSKLCVEQQDAGGNHETRRAGGFSCIRRLTSVSNVRFCFNLMFSICEKLHLIGFSRTPDGDYVLLEGRALMLHYVAALCCLVLCIQKIWSTLLVLMFDDLGPVSFICLTFPATHIQGVLLGACIVLRPHEIMAVLKSWSYDLPSFGEMNDNFKFDPLDDFSTRLKVLAQFCMPVSATCAMASLTTAFDLPVSLVSVLANDFGLPLESILPLSVWRMIFLPLEYISIVVPMLITAFSTSLLFMGTGALQIYLEPVRKMKVLSLQGRKRMEQAYVEVELFSRIFQIWIRRFTPFWLFLAAVGVVFTLFISIRQTELHLLLYVNYPLTAIVFLSTIFWQSYDMFCTCRASEDTLEVLWQYHAPYLRVMTREKRNEVMKRAKAMRPLVFPMGDSEFSLNVPIDTWDEIVNQILFLLSL